MSEETIIEAPIKQAETSRLRAALRRARQTEAERSDVIVDLREAEIARLELLQDALSDVFDEIPEGTDLLECALIPGTPPRLWIDVLAHVVMARDKRTYRFLKDTRHGRQVILETTSIDEMANRVTDYVAHRLIERERALESDSEGKAIVSLAARQAEDKAMTVERTVRRFGWGSLITAFVLGVLIGAVGLFVVGVTFSLP
ncbi:hypothetical protein EDC22_101456 [Tepidamorphus gemmatus]|uniref:Uncharacterized protein n=1 Tax=Tepidamorphus gemmatus TaxID=747076 RepID=A0A4R3MNG1_9HYPH|nr:hypothetical protein [Tepidamorphus gemmatus]TCT13586.1 hypothetical protein EDC22_101456 [Tepidamorphus gemmatus]